ncbi:MAG: hypothetical protein JWP10_437 [Nocardioidaceae bacterium]|nr:hypothetical protein [Nocardioidaceae bacterium]
MTELGIGITNVGPVGINKPGVLHQAQLSERLGADSLHLTDHLLLVENTRSPYPFTPDGKLATAPELPRLESLSTCGWILAGTETIRVGPSVLALTQRNPLEVAKVVATLDVLSGGRMFLGIGTGWLAEEQEALGYDFANRNERFEDWIAVLRYAWSGDTSGLVGEHYSVPEGIYARPTPYEGRTIPLWTGGMTPKARRQSIAIANGWIAVHRVDDDLEKITTLTRAVIDGLADASRARAEFQTVVRVVDANPQNRHKQVQLCRELADIGFDEIVIDVAWAELDGVEKLISDCREALS